MATFLQRPMIETFLVRLGEAFARSGRLYLVGETTQVFEGWLPWTEQLAFTADVASGDRDAFDRAVSGMQRRLGIDVLEESPGDLIPLPDGYAARARPAGWNRPLPAGGGLDVFHFDPYSVAFRFIARGDEPDYHLVLRFLEHGWLEMDEMDALLAGLLPRFTCETIQQDPAEFRRKYKGLLQMRRAHRPDVLHRI